MKRSTTKPMSSGSRISQLSLLAGFFAIIFGVPLGQIAVEWRAGGTIQCTDLVRYAPTPRNLREFERTLEERWWGQETIRPTVQRLLYDALGDTGAKAVASRDGWLFYRPGVRYLAEPDREARRARVVEAVVRFRDQLAERDIRLLVVPVPGKASVYPEKLTRRLAGAAVASPTATFLDDLRRHGVEAVDLFAALRAARSAGQACYLARDTHWTPAGAAVAAKATAERLRELGWAPSVPWEYSTETVRILRYGDILTMMQIPGVRDSIEPESVECTRVLDRMVGPLVPRPDSRPETFTNGHLIDTPLESSVLLLGDSFSRIYQSAEPASLGRLPEGETPSENPTTRRLLPGSAGFPSLLARELRSAVDSIVSDGGAATSVRRRLSVDPEILLNKKVVVWQFAERDIGLGEEGWEPVPVPPASN